MQWANSLHSCCPVSHSFISRKVMDKWKGEGVGVRVGAEKEITMMNRNLTKELISEE